MTEKELNKKVKEYHDMGYRAHNIRMNSLVANKVEEKSRRLHEKYEKHASGAANNGAHWQAANRGDTASIWSGINSLRHKAQASYYKHKINSGTIDKYAIKEHLKSGGAMGVKDNEHKEEN